ncbi:MAG: hypothetical protein Q3997_07645 [Propionibacteriaceae bacterium]|nr:hypothetical protein [Propionibacteriaceae bacterium]
MRFHILLLGALALTACQPTPASPSMPTAPPSRTASPTPTTPPEPSFSGEHHEIYQTVRNFRDALDTWGQNPTPKFDDVIQYTTDIAELMTAEIMSQRIASGEVLKGRPTYRSWSINPPDTLPDGTREATVIFCQDSRSMSILLEDGTILPRELLYWETYTVQQQPNNTWCISNISNKETESC